jgi:hydrogenase maturation protease
MILLIGFGNSLRRDDGAGPALANMVLANESFEDIRIIETHQLTPELAEEVAAPDVSAVIFMDSRVVQVKIDECCRPADVELHRLDSIAVSPSFSHQCDPSSVMSYAELLCGRKPPAWFVSIPGVDFTHGEGFSDVTMLSLAVARDKVCELLMRLRMK